MDGGDSLLAQEPVQEPAQELLQEFIQEAVNGMTDVIDK